MTNKLIPYLCGGTFLAQVLRARSPLMTATDHINGKKESLTEREVFRRLISIFWLTDFYGDTSLKTYTSEYKSCKKSLEEYTRFSDYDLRRQFDEDIKSTNSKALQMTSEFVRDCIDTKYYTQLVRSLLDIIQNDAENLDGTSFYVFEDAKAVTGKELSQMDTFIIEPFLLGVWHFIIMYRSTNNEKGAATYRQWYPNGSTYCGDVGKGIAQEIYVKSASVEHIEPLDSDAEIPSEEFTDIHEGNSENAQTVNQVIEHATIVNQYGGKNIHIDHVDTLNL